MYSQVHQLLGRLYEIRAAAYLLKQERFLPGGKEAIDDSLYYYLEFICPQDLRVGARYIQSLAGDPAGVLLLYDGEMQVQIDHENGIIKKRKCRDSSGQMAGIYVPFFTRIKGLLNFILESKGRKIILTGETNRYIKVEFPQHMIISMERRARDVTFSPGIKKPYSKFEIQLDSDGLPVSLQSENSLGKCDESLISLEINHLELSGYDFSKHIPENYREQTPDIITSLPDLTGQKAPDWTIQDIEGRKYSMSDLHGKVIILHFTAMGCGSCILSFPFLKRLAMEYAGEINLVSIEIPGPNPKVLYQYLTKEGINYPHLLGTSEMIEKYKVRSIPVFYLLDQHKIIRYRFLGFRPGSTDRKIRELIVLLLSKVK